MSLRDSKGLILGPMTTTFRRCENLEDPPWSCFSILFQDRTLDLAVAPAHSESWFMGLQGFLLLNSACVSALTQGQFLFRQVYFKIFASAHKNSFTTSAWLVRGLRALGKDPAFREALEKERAGGSFEYKAALATSPSSAADAEAEAKAERRRQRREAKARAAEEGSEAKPEKSKRDSLERVPFQPPSRDSASASASVSPSASPASSAAAPAQAKADQEQDLQNLAAELDKALAAASARVEALEARWLDSLAEQLPFAKVAEALRSDDARWHGESCLEIERELLHLQLTSKTMQRQVQAAEKVEKQLKKMAKLYKETDAQVQAMEAEVGSAQASAKSTETARRGASEALESTEVQTSHLERRVAELQEQLQQVKKGGSELEVLAAQNETQLKDLKRLEDEKDQLNKQLEAVAADVKASEARCQEAEAKVKAAGSASKRQGDFLKKLRDQLGGLKEGQANLREAAEGRRSLVDSFPPLAGAIQNIGSSTNSILDKYHEVAEERKKLHNLVLELKGNIRVFVRVRPMSDKEKTAEVEGEATITFAEDNKVSVYDANQQRRKWFEFDQAFQPKSLQQEVFEEVKPLATSVLDGYNVCIFAYGQTGSGKTFTMTGNPENPGLNTRVLKELFRIREQRKEEIDISISLSVTEIYNEQIKDLFNPDSAKKKLDVKQNPDGTNTVPGLTERPVSSVEEVLQFMAEAQSNRTVMATDMNEESSRSHSIVQVKTVNVNRKDNSQYLGKINLIDLAGSENVNKSGVQGQGMREAQNINKSLFALGDVIASLVSKNSKSAGHVPYRNSKLTMMLKDSLGGDSKTMMIVQCSPAQSNVTETLSSLNFASRARNVELGKAKQHKS